MKEDNKNAHHLQITSHRPRVRHSHLASTE